MKKFFIILLFCCSVYVANSQVEWITDRDSLRQLIKNGSDDTLKVFRLGNLAVLYTYNYPDTSLKYCHLMLELARRLNYKGGIAGAYDISSSAYNVLGNYALAMHNAFEAIKIYQETKDIFGLKHINDVIAEIYYEMGDYKTALAYEYKVRKVIESLSDTFYTSGTMQLKKENIMYSDAGLSAEYLLANMPDSALYFAKRVYDADRELGMFWSNTPLVLGNAYLNSNQLDSALKYYRSLIKIHAQNDEIDINTGIAGVFQKTGQIDSCIYYAKMALDSARAIRYTKAVMNSSELLSRVYEKINPAEAIRYYQINSAAKDSLYNREKVNEVSSLIFGEERRVRDLQEAQSNYRNTLRMYALITLAGIFLLIGAVLYRNNRHRKKAFFLLIEQKKETDIQKEKAELALEELKSIQSQLIQSEKMASLGELTAGIAHEIQNPLNFVNNFSEVSNELIDEMKTELANNNKEEAIAIADDLKQNLEKINHHGKRADAIVKGMLQHSRTSTGHKEPTDINKLADEYLRLSYQGLRAKDKSFNATMHTDFDETIGKINIIPQDIGRVLLNLYNNAFYTVNEKKKSSPGNYEPTVSVSTKKISGKVEVKVSDNGNGVPQKVLDKIFQPFFTTKPTGQGTGLGLSLSYDIIKAHGGELKVETKEGEFADFVIILPV